GKHIPEHEIKAIIASLGIKIRKETDAALTVEVPPYKVDVTREVDIVEEVLRIYGYNNVEIKRKIKASLSPSRKPDKEVVQNQLSDLLIANGFREILCNSLSRIDYVDDPETAVKILNPLSSDLDTMRQNLLFSALEAVAYNQRRRQENLKFFEFGTTYRTTGDGYAESYRLSLVMTGKRLPEQWNHTDEPVSFFHIKAAVEAVLRRLGISGLQIGDAPELHYQYGLTYSLNGKYLV